MQTLHTFLIVSLVFTFCMVIFSSNPIHSVLYLILSFCFSSAILLLFRIDFLGILFVIIYVGAIAVLFLFVVMMLNVKVFEINYIYASVLPLIILFLIFNLSFLNNIINEGVDFLFIDYNQMDSIDSFNNIDSFGQVFFGYYISIFLLSGIVLLVAMLGAIILTLIFKTERSSELSSRQLARESDFIAFFK